jgi:hypothetical protein
VAVEIDHRLDYGQGTGMALPTARSAP